MPFFRQKLVDVEAFQISEDLALEYDRGRQEGKRGDWLIRNSEGELYLCSDFAFRTLYAPLDKKAEKALTSGPEPPLLDA